MRRTDWPKIRANGLALADAIGTAGGSIDAVDLPQAGIGGNSHMVMMDKNNHMNNLVVAATIQNGSRSRDR